MSSGVGLWGLDRERQGERIERDKESERERARERDRERERRERGQVWGFVRD
jgi:hypothetical protein